MRDEIKNLIEDAELAKKVDKLFTDTLKGYVLKSDYDASASERDNLNKEIKSRDKQLEDLKKVNVDDLKNQITALQEQNSNAKKEFEKALRKQKFDAAIDLDISESEAINPKAVKFLALDGFDVEKAEFDDRGRVKGFSDRLKALQKSDTSKMLFKVYVPKGTKLGEGSDPLPNGEDSFGAKAAKEYNAMFGGKKDS